MEKKERVYQSVVNCDYKRFVAIAERRTGIQVHRQQKKRSTPQIMVRRMVYNYMGELGYSDSMVSKASGINRTTIIYHRKQHNRLINEDTIVATRYRAIFCELRLCFMRGTTPDAAVVGRAGASPYVYPGVEPPIGLETFNQMFDQ